MKSFAFLFAACVLAASAAFSAPPQGAPAQATVPCPMMAQGAMGPGMMGGNATMMPCPAMHGGKMAPGHCACPAMSSPRKGAADCTCPCPGMRTAAPSAVSKTGPAGSTNPTVYGWQLMTAEEKAAYRAKLRAAKTPEERAKLRAEHHQEMEARAKQQGVTLPPAAAS